MCIPTVSLYCHFAILLPFEAEDLCPIPRFYYYYMASGKTDISPDAISDKYSHVKRVTWEDYMRATPIEKLVGYAKA